MPSGDTFSIGPIATLLAGYLNPIRAAGGVIVDPFARNSRLATHTNDLNPATDAQHHIDAADYCRMLLTDGVVADAVLFDPPYSPRQISECYESFGRKATTQDTQNAALYARVREPLVALLRPGGIGLSFGWNSTGLGKALPTIEIMLVAHGGAHNDTICVVQRKDQATLSLPQK